MMKEKLGLFTDTEVVMSEVSIKEEVDSTVSGIVACKQGIGSILIATGGATAAGGFVAAGV